MSQEFDNEANFHDEPDQTEERDLAAEAAAHEKRMNVIKAEVAKYADLKEDEIKVLFPSEAALEKFHSEMNAIRASKDDSHLDEDGDDVLDEDNAILSPSDIRHASDITRRIAEAAVVNAKVARGEQRKAYDAAASHLPQEDRVPFDEAPPVNYDEFMKSIMEEEE